LILKLIFCLGAGIVRQWAAQSTPPNDTLHFNSLPNCIWRHVPPKCPKTQPISRRCQHQKWGSTNTTNVTNRNEKQNVWGLAKVTRAGNVRLVTGSC